MLGKVRISLCGDNTDTSKFITHLEEKNWRHRFEENSQDFFLLREFQNIREGPDTCICQRRFPNSIVLKKPECLEKLTWQRGWSRSCFTRRVVLETGRRQSLFPECFTCSSSSFLWTTLFNTLFFFFFLNTISMKENKNKTMRQKQRELTAHLEV